MLRKSVWTCALGVMLIVVAGAWWGIVPDFERGHHLRAAVQCYHSHLEEHAEPSMLHPAHTAPAAAVVSEARGSSHARHGTHIE